MKKLIIVLLIVIFAPNLLPGTDRTSVVLEDLTWIQAEKALKDFDSRPNRKGLTRDPKGEGHYSPTGIWGDPSLATKKKGKIIVEAAVSEIIRQVKELIALNID